MVSSTAGFNSCHYNKCLLQNKNNLESWWLWSTNAISFSKVGIAFGILNLNQMLKVIPVKISHLIYTQCLIFMWFSPVFCVQKKVLALMQNAHEPLQNLHLKWSEWSLMSLYQGQLCFCLHPCNIRASLCIWTPVRLVKNRSMNCQCRFLSSLTLLLCLLHWCPICVGHCFGYNAICQKSNTTESKNTNEMNKYLTSVSSSLKSNWPHHTRRVIKMGKFHRAFLFLLNMLIFSSIWTFIALIRSTITSVREHWGFQSCLETRFMSVISVLSHLDFGRKYPVSLTRIDKDPSENPCWCCWWREHFCRNPGPHHTISYHSNKLDW